MIQTHLQLRPQVLHIPAAEGDGAVLHHFEILRDVAGQDTFPVGDRLDERDRKPLEDRRLHHHVGVRPELVQQVAIHVAEHRDPLIAVANLHEGIDVTITET